MSDHAGRPLLVDDNGVEIDVVEKIDELRDAAAHGPSPLEPFDAVAALRALEEEE